MSDNKLYYGENLDVLRRHVKAESVDLVYLDPPFNSNADYNVLFARKDGTQASAQIQAFEDTWRWDMAAARALDEVVQRGGHVGDALLALQRLLGESDMMAYLAMMAPRLVELRRVLKPSGSIYLHCDPTASHYLKLLTDAVFGPANFRSEIIWKRSSAHSDTKQGRKDYGHIHDVILFYTKSHDKWTWNPQFVPYDDDYVRKRFSHEDDRGRYKDADLSAARPGGDTSYPWRIKRSTGGSWTHDLEAEFESPKEGWEYKAALPPSGRYWAYSQENMRNFAAEGRLHYFSTGTPRMKQYASELSGVALQDLWIDIAPINARAAERLGYPTQKPTALLERIIETSTNEGDVVLDPFCGCGTTIAAAHASRRNWIGIDITHLAVNLMKHRLQNTFGPSVEKEYDVIGEPTTVEGAWELAKSDPYQFQFWALGLVGARPHEEKKGADKGIDGRLHFLDPETGQYQNLVISVKAGKPTVSHLRDLRGVVDRENAAIGVLITMQDPTRPMVKEAATGQFYDSPFGQHPSLQILTVGQLLGGARIDYPRQADVTIKRAPRQHRKDSEQLDLTAGED